MSEEIRKKRGRPRLVDVAGGDHDAPENCLGSPETLDEVEASGGWQEFFGDGTERTAVQLFRLEPRFWEGGNIYGYISELQRDDGLQVIKDNYGGGLYAVRQTVNGRYRRQKQVRIAGDPRVVHPPPSDASVNTIPSPEKPAPSLAGVPTVNVKGVPIPVDDFESIKRVVLFTKAMDVIFPRPTDVNETLLKLILQQRGQPSDVLDQAEQFTTLAEKLKSLTGYSGGGGTTWMDIAGQALDKVDKFVSLAASKKSAIPAIPRPVTGRLPSSALSKGSSLLAEAGRDMGFPDRETVDPQTKEPVEVEYRDIAEKAASYIVQGFVVEPQQTPAETVAVLDAVLPIMSQKTRQGLESHRRVLCLVAHSILSNQVETDAAYLSQFDLYFNDVFDIFIGVPGDAANQQPSSRKADDVQQQQSPQVSDSGTDVK
jgi:hypothetical protein